MMWIPWEVSESVAQQALRDLAGGTEDPTALVALAGCEVLIPVVAGVSYAHGHPDFVHLLLPLAERKGRHPAALVFTSEERMARALREVHRYRPVILGQLIEHWPLAGVGLIVDPGHPDSLSLSPRCAKRRGEVPWRPIV